MASLGGDIARLIDLYPRIFFACHRRHVRDQETDREVSERQVQILDHLDEKAPTRLSELANHLGVTASTMSLAIDRLERAGYARRTKGARDRRQVDIRLTGSGARVREARFWIRSECTPCSLTFRRARALRRSMGWRSWPGPRST